MCFSVVEMVKKFLSKLSAQAMEFQASFSYADCSRVTSRQWALKKPSGERASPVARVLAAMTRFDYRDTDPMKSSSYEGFSVMKLAVLPLEAPLPAA